jgi:hypothetical protein
MCCDVGQMNQTDVLPDDALLEIFYFYVNTFPLPEEIPSDGYEATIEAWQVLVHVCRRWRSIVLGSPRHLNLRLYCTPQTSIRDTLDVWPAFPLVVDSGGIAGLPSSDADNLIAILGQSNRICQVDLYLADRELGAVLAAMQMPFPELTDLRVSSIGIQPPTIPDSFLGGSSPRLRDVFMRGIPFLGLPNLLLSATHLVSLWLTDIPHSGYFSPEAIVAPLSAMSSLKTLYLEFQSPQSRPDRSLPPPKRSVLPALDTFHFRGASEYLEDFVTRIDTPQLDDMNIDFFDQVDFDCSLLAQFINRSPTLVVRDAAQVQFIDYVASVTLIAQSGTITIAMYCRELDRQISSITRVCNSPMHPLSSVHNLYIVHQYQQLVGAIENALWLQLLLSFTAVKNLYLSKDFAPGIAAALQEPVGSKITEVLPSLQNIFVDQLDPSGPFQENIGRFVAARQLSDHPIVISIWRRV